LSGSVDVDVGVGDTDAASRPPKHAKLTRRPTKATRRTDKGSPSERGLEILPQAPKGLFGCLGVKLQCFRRE
ncbi:MAG TPA: hypothetical protein VNZ67_01035, partial [bacterium]|nr:hypothetical protein [bacterium]